MIHDVSQKPTPAGALALAPGGGSEIKEGPLDDLLQKVWDGGRIDGSEALRLSRLSLEELGTLADRRLSLARGRAHGGRGNELVTYIVDRNVNYTNVCNVYCKFCAFYRTEKDDDSYVISLDELDRKIEEYGLRKEDASWTRLSSAACCSC